MRGLSLTQPWASLMAIGAKTIETRSRRWSYRGWVAIHASKEFPKDARRLCYQEPFASALAKHGYVREGQLPLSSIIALVEISDCWQTEDVATRISGTERAFGDYRPGRSAYFTRRLIRLPEPIPARGMLGLW